MTEKERLIKEIADAEAALEPKKARLREIRNKEDQVIAARIAKAQQGKGDFTLDELRFAASARCACGAGMCYPLDSPPNGSWECSDILRGLALPKTDEASKTHSGPLPFAFYEVKSEDQMIDSQRRYRDAGITTRPES